MEKQRDIITKTNPLLHAFVHSLGVVLYVALVALFMSNGERILGQEDTIFVMMVVLLLLTLSVAVVGSLIFAKPILLAIRGQRREAVEFALITIGFLFIESIILIIVFAFIS